MVKPLKRENQEYFITIHGCILGLTKEQLLETLDPLKLENFL